MLSSSRNQKVQRSRVRRFSKLPFYHRNKIIRSRRLRNNLNTILLFYQRWLMRGQISGHCARTFVLGTCTIRYPRLVVLRTGSLVRNHFHQSRLTKPKKTKPFISHQTSQNKRKSNNYNTTYQIFYLTNKVNKSNNIRYVYQSCEH